MLLNDYVLQNFNFRGKTMSGINGFNWSDKALISRMNGCMKHRGPDGDGVFVNDIISLGHVRLSVIDLSEKGKQPMTNEDESIWITYDGRVYNFPMIRKKLESKGFKFNSRTDAEVILHSYKEKGTRSFENFNGIFTFCIYDSNKKCIYLVRDRLGVKPLYYHHNDDKFIFSSEIKTFCILEDISFLLDDNAILEYFLTRNISSESFFKNIRALEPGHYLKYDLVSHRISKHTYFDIYKVVTKERFLRNYERIEKELIDELDILLNNVVKDQLISDIPVGIICSGGVDSSLLTAIAKKYTDDLKIFNVKVDDKYLDESTFAKRVAEHLGLHLIVEELNQKKFKELYKKCINLADLPFIHPNSVGIHLINMRAKDEGINVILGGEGSDELFGGYDHHRYFYRRLILTKTPLLDYLNKKGRMFFYFKDFTSYLLEDTDYLIKHYRDLPFNVNRRNANKIFYDTLAFLEDDFERVMTSYILKDLKYYLPPTLREAERMAMGAGVELRIPFVDSRIVDFATNLPLKYKTSFFKTKYLVKKVAERYLPKCVVYRRKLGFGIPTEKWLGDKNLDFKKVMFSEWEKIYGLN